MSIRLYLSYLVCLASLHAAHAEDWPTYLHDNQRSGITAEMLELPLREEWRYLPAQPPQPSWPAPAERNYWGRNENLAPRVTYDRAFHVTAVGERFYFSSSANDTVYCHFAESGSEAWRFTTDGPVRVAPTIHAGKAYVGSDDGAVYCLDAQSGELIWKHHADPNEKKIVGNGRLISPRPVRTAVLLQDGVAYAAKGIFPTEGVTLYALDPDTGEERWSKSLNVSPQGYLLSSQQQLFVPNGRAAPVTVRIDTHEIVSPSVAWGHGGTYALVMDDALIYGPGINGQLDVVNPSEKGRIARFNGLHMLVTPARSILHSQTELSALDRVRYFRLIREQKKLSEQQKKLTEAVKALGENPSPDALTPLTQKLHPVQERLGAIVNELADCFLWRQPCAQPYALILAGNVIFAGGENEIAAYDFETGSPLWSGKVEGRAYGLTLANGALYVSTNTGAIHRFGSRIHSEDETAEPRIVSTGGFVMRTGEILDRPTASRIHNIANVERGYCLLIGNGSRYLPYDLRKPELKVVCLDESEGDVSNTRSRLEQSGAYGTGFSIMQGDYQRLPFTDRFANLIAVEPNIDLEKTPINVGELLRALRPNGGVAVLGSPLNAELADWFASTPEIKAWEEKGAISVETVDGPGEGRWLVVRRGALEGAGAWTHQYADPGNTSSSGDSLSASRTRLQWFGKPGPRQMIDRHHRTVAPLALNGQLYIPANDKVIAVDAYNGTKLWEIDVPQSRRVAAPLDAGNRAVTDNYFYITTDNSCWGIDVQTGQKEQSFAAPSGNGENLYWGYLAALDNVLIGSGEYAAASRTELSRDDIVEHYKDYRPLSTSRTLFAFDRNTHDLLWEYRKGVVLNTAIAADDDAIYFVESRNPQSLADEDGKITLEVLLANDAYLVALDVTTGRKTWERPVDLTECDHVLYLSLADGVLVATGSKDRKDLNANWYTLYAFEAQSGADLWMNGHRNNRDGTGGDHGEQVHHPVIAGQIVIAEPAAYDLHTGKLVNPLGGQEEWSIPTRGGCGTISGSAQCIFYRDSNPSAFQFGENGGLRKLTQVTRPGCWINIIPAGGLILIPEASSGCVCSFPIQTSLALIPE